MKITSRSVQETMDLAERIGRLLKPGDTLGLIGELGSGKTVFAKGIARGLKVRNIRYVNSPSFVIIKEHKGRTPLYHIDVYRLNGVRSSETVPYDEYFYGDGVTVVEWADRIAALFPKEHIMVQFRNKGGTTRDIFVKGMGKRYKEMVRRIAC